MLETFCGIHGSLAGYPECWRDLGVLGYLAHLPDSASPGRPAASYRQSYAQPAHPPPRLRGSGAGLELKNAEVSVSTSLKDFLSQRLISVRLTRLLVCQWRVPALPTVGSTQGCDLGVGSELGIWAPAGPFVPGLEWEGEENVLISSQPWKPHPLAVGV